MKVLFVDDSSVRHRKLLDALSAIRPGLRDSVDWVKTSYKAIDYLKNNHVDLLLLDHDLGLEQPENTEDGIAVAKWLADNPDKFQNTLVVLHSFNIPAVKNMLAVLKDLPNEATYIRYDADQLAKVIVSASE